MGMATPDENFIQYYEKTQARIAELPTTILALAAQDVSLGEVLISKGQHAEKFKTKTWNPEAMTLFLSYIDNLFTMNHFGSNIQHLRKRKKISQEDLAVELGIKRSSLSGYELGNSEPSFETLLAFSEFFKISLDKLLKLDLKSVSEIYLKQLEQGVDVDITGAKLRVLATTVDGDNEENIELVPIKAKAGYSAGYGDPDFIKVLPTFQLPFLDRSKKFRTFQINGDSMPPVSDKSWVTGEFIQNWNTIKDGYPYIVVTENDGVVFKILYKQFDKNQTFLLCSTNPIYEPYDINVNEVNEIWKFVNYISNEMPEPNLNRDQLNSSISGLQRELREIKNTLRKKEAQTD